MDRNTLVLILFALMVFVLVVIDRWISGPKKFEFSKPNPQGKTMNTNENSTKSNEKVDVARIAFPVALIEAVLVGIIAMLAGFGIYAMYFFVFAFIPLMVGAFVGGALGKRAGGNWKGVAKAAVCGSLLALALGYVYISYISSQS